METPIMPLTLAVLSQMPSVETLIRLLAVSPTKRSVESRTNRNDAPVAVDPAAPADNMTNTNTLLDVEVGVMLTVRPVSANVADDMVAVLVSVAWTT